MYLYMCIFGKRKIPLNESDDNYCRGGGYSSLCEDLLSECGVDGAAHVGKRSEFLEGLCGFEEAAAADGDLDEFRVELGGEEASDHVGDLGDEVRVEGVAGGEGFGGEAVGEAGEDHSDGVVGREGKVGEGDVGFQLVDDGGEDRVGEAVEGAPVGVAERGFE